MVHSETPRFAPNGPWQKISAIPDQTVTISVMTDSRIKAVLPLGPVPLSDEDTVFTTLYGALGSLAQWLPDGQTGERQNVLGWQYERLAGNSHLEADPDAPALTVPAVAGGASTSYPRLRLKGDVEKHDIQLDLGYGEAAKSYVHFAGLKRTGRMSQDTRFLATLPSSTSVSALFISPEHRADFVPIHERAVLSEIEILAGAITHAELAIQFDLQVEACLSVNPDHYWQKDVIADEVARVSRLASAVPQLVQVGFRLRRKPAAPVDKGELIAVSDEQLITFANALGHGLGRDASWLSLPFADAQSSADFGALSKLDLPAQCLPIIGLLNKDDTVEVAASRISAVAEHLDAFGISTPGDWTQMGEKGLSELLGLIKSLP